MFEFLGFDDNKSNSLGNLEIGMVLLLVASLLYFVGVIFFFVRSLLLLSNVRQLTFRSSF